MTGTPGVADTRAVMNFADIARKAGPAAGPPHALRASPNPASSFLAMLGEGELIARPDTQGAVGPNHLMVTLNTSVRMQTRNGAVLSTVSLSNFWAAVGPFDVFYFDGLPFPAVVDPKVLYDPYEGRFIFATLCNVYTTNSALLIGVSQTSDPTGNWNLYRFRADASGQTYIDFPFMGFNKDWIAVRALMLNVSGDAFNRVHIYAFNKTNLYAGGSGTFTLFASSNIGKHQTPATTFDTDVSTLYLLQQMGEGARNINTLRLYTITGAVDSPVFTIGPTVTATNRWDYIANTGDNSNFSPQLGSTRKIYTKRANIYTLVYRNGSLWAAQTIYLPANAGTRNAVQWWQISPTGGILQRGLIDDPTGKLFYDYPSLSVNQFNDVLIGYNRFSTNQYGSANYSFRAGNDPSNTLRADTVLKAGEAPVDFVFPNWPYNDWGDYSATMVDPVNDLDLWTIQEYASANIGGFGGGDNWGTWWGRISPIRVTAVELAGADARIRFTTAPDQTYRVERTASLAGPIVWEPVPGATNVAGTGAIVEVTDAGAVNQAQQFYRIALLP